MPKYPNLPSVGKDVVFEGGSLADLKAFPDEPRRDAIYVLHAFRKTTQHTAQPDIDLAARRYKEFGKESQMSKRYKSVWDAIEDDPHVAQHLKLRSELMIALQQHLRGLKLTQKEIAELLGIHQPRVSDLFSGKVQSFSLDRLIDHASDAGLHITLKAKAA